MGIDESGNLYSYMHTKYCIASVRSMTKLVCETLGLNYQACALTEGQGGIPVSDFNVAREVSRLGISPVL